jgi:hypothetical protein
MGIKLGDVSPLVGMATGKGMFGKAMRQGFGGMIPAAIARDAYSDEEEQQRQAQLAAQMSSNGMRMKKGGTASSRADGCAQRGKTRGKML